MTTSTGGTSAVPMEVMIAVLLKAGLFEMQNGKATINFHEGHIQTVHLDTMTYKHPTSTKA